jgi:hypothetical protein
MRIATLFIAVLIIPLIVSVNDVEAKDEVYRWTDENGVVHFERRPEAHTNAEQVIIRKSPASSTPSSTVDTSTLGDQKQEPQPSYPQQRRDERERKRQENAERQNEIAAGCEQRRQIVSRLEPSTRVMVNNKDGTVSRLDDNVRLEALAEAKAYIAEKCDK